MIGVCRCAPVRASREASEAAPCSAQPWHSRRHVLPKAPVPRGRDATARDRTSAAALRSPPTEQELLVEDPSCRVRGVVCVPGTSRASRLGGSRDKVIR